MSGRYRRTMGWIAATLSLTFAAATGRIAAQNPVPGLAETRIRTTVEGGKVPELLLVLRAVDQNAKPRRYVSRITTADQFFLPRVIGEYRLAVSGLPSGYSVRSFMAGQTNLLTDPIRMPYQDTQEIRLVLQFSPSSVVKVSGHVTRMNEARVAPTRIILEPAMDGLRSASASIGRDGSFELPQVKPGSYKVRFDPKGDSVDRALGVEANGISDLRIPAFVATYRVRGILPSKKELAKLGYVFDAFKMKDVYLVNQDQEEDVDRLTRQMAARNVMTRTGYFEPFDRIGADLSSKGEFEFTDVPAGTYKLGLVFSRQVESDVIERGLVETALTITVDEHDLDLSQIDLQSVAPPTDNPNAWWTR